MIHKTAMTKYNRMSHPPIAMQLARFGHTTAEIAQILGITVATLKRWEDESPVLAEALKLGKAAVVSDCEAALFKCATGYTYEDVEVKTYRGKTEKVRVMRTAQPQWQAALKILERMDRERWGDVQRMEMSQTITNIAKFELPAELFSVEELRLFDKIVKMPRALQDAN